MNVAHNPATVHIFNGSSMQVTRQQLSDMGSGFLVCYVDALQALAEMEKNLAVFALRDANLERRSGTEAGEFEKSFISPVGYGCRSFPSIEACGHLSFHRSSP